MAGDDKGAPSGALVEQDTAQVVVDGAGDEAATSEPVKLEKGWLHHLESDTYHEVDDKEGVLAAYPGQYEVSKKPSDSKKIGW